jgi:hypothetical protein
MTPEITGCRFTASLRGIIGAGQVAAGRAKDDLRASDDAICRSVLLLLTPLFWRR